MEFKFIGILFKFSNNLFIFDLLRVEIYWNDIQFSALLQKSYNLKIQKEINC